MQALRDLARRMGGGALALVLALLVLAPALDSLVCAGDGVTPDIHAAASAAFEAPSAPAGDHRTIGSAGDCIHGHAHAGVACLSDAGSQPAGLARAAARHASFTPRPLRSIAPVNEDPPPRA